MTGMSERARGLAERFYPLAEKFRKSLIGRKLEKAEDWESLFPVELCLMASRWEGPEDDFPAIYYTHMRHRVINVLRRLEHRPESIPLSMSSLVSCPDPTSRPYISELLQLVTYEQDKDCLLYMAGLSDKKPNVNWTTLRLYACRAIKEIRAELGEPEAAVTLPNTGRNPNSKAAAKTRRARLKKEKGKEEREREKGGL